MAGARNRDTDLDYHPRLLSTSCRGSNDLASDPAIIDSKLIQLFRAEKSDDLASRVYPHLNKIFQRAVVSISQVKTSNGLLLLAILQFFLDYGEVGLHDWEPSLQTFFRSGLSCEFADPQVAEATLVFLNSNLNKFVTTFPSILPQFFPLMLKLIGWGGER